MRARAAARPPGPIVRRGYPVDNWRNTVGVQWEFLKKRKIDVYYIYRPDYAKEFYNRTYHIFGAELSADVKFPR